MSLAENAGRGSPASGIRSVIDSDGYAGVYSRECISVLTGWRTIGEPIIEIDYS